MTARDAWLFLTPEVERLVPALLGAADGRGAEALGEEIEEIICRGDSGTWFRYLRSCRGTLEREIDRGADPQVMYQLALILRDQYLLAPSVYNLGAAGEREAQLLEDLVERTAMLAGDTGPSS
ncbi:MAG: hypothetical protein ACRDTR_21950 [Rubrobacter sp.]